MISQQHELRAFKILKGMGAHCYASLIMSLKLVIASVEAQYNAHFRLDQCCCSVSKWFINNVELSHESVVVTGEELSVDWGVAGKERNSYHAFHYLHGARIPCRTKSWTDKLSWKLPCKLATGRWTTRWRRLRKVRVMFDIRNII